MPLFEFLIYSYQERLVSQTTQQFSSHLNDCLWFISSDNAGIGDMFIKW